MGSSLSGNFVNDFAGGTLDLSDFYNMAKDDAQILITDIAKADGKDVFNGFADLVIKMDADELSVSSQSYNSTNNKITFFCGSRQFSLALQESGSSKNMVLSRLA